ncbi:MAG: hypothetical protein H6577_12775 [Lewinellaceae bacterium]|nr:hypothetical protein [Saprospiraceae bacterium]MCB9338996.1 hypothetical protein [Lewinellaceae bacterium]
MPITSTQQFNLEDHLIFNENAQFFKKKGRIPKKTIANLFQALAKNKVGKPFQKTKVLFQFEEKTAYWSILIFKEKRFASFIDQPHPDWQEERFCFLLLIEYGQYCVVVKRNISGLSRFQSECLEPIDYIILSRLLISEKTDYQGLKLQNIDPSEYSTRTKSLASNDLKKSMSPFGIHRYIVRGMKISNSFEQYALTLNTSRINKMGEKSHLESLFKSVVKIVDKIIAFKNQGGYLDNFARPLDFEDHAKKLTPVGILFLWGELEDLIENGLITAARYPDENGEEKTLNARIFLRYLKQHNRLLTINDLGSRPSYFPIENPFDNQAFLAFNEKSFTVRSRILNQITLHFENKAEEGLIDWINRKRLFITTFEEADIVYFSGSLFQDSRLLGSIEMLKDSFIPHPDLATVTSEKGKFKATSKAFSNDSIFHFIEDKLNSPDREYLFCDDLGDEWADFIEIKPDKVCLYHAKYKNSVGLSASDLQDVIGQAQKNLGNVVPGDERINNKLKSWDGCYKMDKKLTKIEKKRKGSSVSEGVEAYKRRTASSITHFEIYLVINFISKKQLFDNFERLRDGGKVEKKAQVIQLLWFISSFVNSCKEIGFKPFIVCQP